MPHAPTPWVGLVALAAMFLLPFLPAWLLDGPRTIKHRPARHVCADCNARWTNGHVCGPEAPVSPEATEARPPLRAELRRLATSTELELPPEQERPPG